jgi:hypothetical protein
MPALRLGGALLLLALAIAGGAVAARQHTSSRGQRVIVLPNGREIPDLRSHWWEPMGGVANTPFW